MRTMRGDELDPRLTSLLACLLDFEGESSTSDQKARVGPLVGLPIFRTTGWQAVLAPFRGFRFDGPTYRGLIAGSSAAGDDCIVVTDVDTWPGHGEAIVFQWPHTSWDEVVMSGDIVNVFDCALFGDSGDWLAYLDHEEWCMIGGSQTFMQAFLDTAGGEQAVRNRFVASGSDLLRYTIPITYRRLLQRLGR